MKDNGILKKKRATTFWVALLMSVGFVAGIPAIVFGATKGWTLLMVAGIVLTAVGFYVMPMMWVRFGNLSSKYNVLKVITDDGITDVSLIASNFGWNEKNTSLAVRWLIANRYLTGVTFDGKEITSTTPKKQRRMRCMYCGTIVNDLNAVRCPNCSAQLTMEDVDHN